MVKRDARWLDLRNRSVGTPKFVCIHPPPRLGASPVTQINLRRCYVTKKTQACSAKNFNGVSTPGLSSGIRVKIIWEIWKSRCFKCAHWAKRLQVAYFITTTSPMELKPPPGRSNGSRWKLTVYRPTWGVLSSWLTYRWRVSYGDFAHSVPIDADRQGGIPGNLKLWRGVSTPHANAFSPWWEAALSDALVHENPIARFNFVRGELDTAVT